MELIKKIKDNIEFLETSLQRYFQLSKQDPDNYAYQFTLKSLTQQIKELQFSLYQENIKREREIVKLVFKGGLANYGSIPLKSVGGLTDSFAKAILSTSKYVQFGDTGQRKLDKMIDETVDLRLNGIGQGSTVFYLSALTSPDLTGTSLIQNSLDNVFDLLNTENSETLLDKIYSVGTRSIKHYSSFLKEVTSARLEVDIVWNNPDGLTKKWVGTKEKIVALNQTLSTIKTTEPETIHIVGDIITLSLKGKFEILTADNIKYNGDFPIELTDKIKQLHVGSLCKAIILKTTIINELAKTEKFEYLLKDIEPFNSPT